MKKDRSIHIAKNIVKGIKRVALRSSRWTQIVWLILLLTGVTARAQVLEQDSLALVAFYHTTGGDQWINNTNWLAPGQNVPTWFGVDISEGRVSELLLNDNNLTGSLPEEIGDLTGLYSLALSDNHLSGVIPDSMSKMHRMIILGLGNNDYTGDIPSFLFQMPLPPNVFGTPRIILLMDNNFTGISPWDGEFKHMADLAIESNNLGFTDLELMFPQTIYFFSYTPQGSIYLADDVTVFVNSVVTLKTTTGGSANHYQWLKDGVLIPTAIQENYTLEATLTDEGVYTAEVTNDIVTGLTLERNPIAIHVKKDTIYTSCDGSPIALSVAVSDPLAVYQWSHGETTPSVALTASGKYGVRIETSNYILKDTIEVVIQPALSLGDDVDTCEPSAILSSNITDGDSYQWRTPTGEINNQSALSATVDGLYIVEVTKGTCFRKDSVEVTLNRFTAGDFNMKAGIAEVEDNGVVLSDVALTFTNTTGTGTGFAWSFDENTVNEEAPTYAFGKPGKYAITLTGVDNRNCPITVEKAITVEDLVITNAISPNGDGKNDQLFIEPFLYSAEIKVVNRWGRPVYESSVYNNDFTGANLESGVYYYELYFKDVNKRYKGYVHVMKNR